MQGAVFQMERCPWILGLVNSCQYCVARWLGRHISESVFHMQIGMLLSSKMDELGRRAEECHRNGVQWNLSHPCIALTQLSHSPHQPEPMLFFKLPSIKFALASLCVTCLSLSVRRLVQLRSVLSLSSLRAMHRSFPFSVQTEFPLF